MKRLILIAFGILCFLLLLSCGSHFTYIPPADAEVNSGHFMLFYNEITSPESEELEPIKPTIISVEILQEGKTIISDILDTGNWNLYPVPEGVYVVNLEIDFPDKPIVLKRSFNSKVETVNALNIDFWRVEPAKMNSDVQTKGETFSGTTVGYIMDAKRAGRPLTFDEILRFNAGK